jgi:hypothetical protein
MLHLLSLLHRALLELHSASRDRPSWRLNPKTETDLTTDYEITDTIGYDYQYPEVLPRKIRTLIPNNLFKICEISGICGFNFGI